MTKDRQGLEKWDENRQHLTAEQESIYNRYSDSLERIKLQIMEKWDKDPNNEHMPVREEIRRRINYSAWWVRNSRHHRIAELAGGYQTEDFEKLLEWSSEIQGLIDSATFYIGMQINREKILGIIDILEE